MAYRYGEQTDGVEQSHYDAGYLRILELQKSWQIFRRHYREGNFEKANNELDTLWMEFEVDSKDGQKNQYEEIEEKIVEARKEKNPYQRNALLFKVLKEKRMFLGQVEKTQGMGKRYFDESSEDLI
jgi:hypothetical protein